MAGKDDAPSPSNKSIEDSADRSLPAVDTTLVRIGERLTPAVIKQNYAIKFALSLGLVVLLISAVGAVSYTQTETLITEDADETLQSTATLSADSIGEWHSSMNAQVRAISAGDVFSSGDSAEISSYLQDMQEQASSDVVAIHYVNTSGTDNRLVASTERIAIGSKPRNNEPTWQSPIRRAAASSLLTTVAVSSSAYETDGHEALAFVSPVRGADGVLIVVGSISAELQHIENPAVPATTLILNETGAPVSTTDTVSTDAYVRDPAFDRARNGAGSLVRTADEVSVYRPIEEASWIVVTAATKSELYRVSRTVRETLILLVGTALLSLGVVAVVLGRQTVIPIVALRKRTEAMKTGDLDIDLQTSRSDEIGRLFRAFDNMRRALRDQIQEAQEAREEAEQSKQELERQNSRLDQFASTLSHDLRNPLTVARGHVELLEFEFEDVDSDAADVESLRTHLEKVEKSHDRIDSIIQDVLTLTREGESVDETSPVALDEAIFEAWSNIDHRDATIEVTESRTIEADRTRLLRLLENLFRNAIDHVGEDVSITVGLTGSGFYIADDGSGIPSEEVDHIFEYGHTTSDDGTGIGLSIVKTIAEAHGWRPYIDTTYEDGAMFVFADVFDRNDPDWHNTGFEWVNTTDDD